ncbi:MAG: hypothetical protein EZS28_012736 [Streblomastix strix]|uniref:Uncharacterized protein n=1 Tax=Streblomastix strix TaxID=222440 RepID=A0A5J4W9X9_9EUKA|nr:MAG: hypothetical protein EZS28_012736 [Streblomastix strix]
MKASEVPSLMGTNWSKQVSNQGTSTKFESSIQRSQPEESQHKIGLLRQYRRNAIDVVRDIEEIITRYHNQNRPVKGGVLKQSLSYCKEGIVRKVKNSRLFYAQRRICFVTLQDGGRQGCQAVNTKTGLCCDVGYPFCTQSRAIGSRINALPCVQFQGRDILLYCNAIRHQACTEDISQVDETSHWLHQNKFQPEKSSLLRRSSSTGVRPNRTQGQISSSFIVSTQSGLDYQRNQVQSGTQSDLQVPWMDVRYCQHDIIHNQKEENQAYLGIKQMDKSYQQQETCQTERSCKADRFSQLSSSPISTGFSPFEITQLIKVEKLSQGRLGQGNNSSEIRSKGNQMVEETIRNQFISIFDNTQPRSVINNRCIGLGMGRSSSAPKRGRNHGPWGSGKELETYFIQLERDSINPLLSKKIRVNTSQQINSSPRNPNGQHDYSIQYTKTGCYWSISKANIDNIRIERSKQDSIINNIPARNSKQGGRLIIQTQSRRRLLHSQTESAENNEIVGGNCNNRCFLDQIQSSSLALFFSQNRLSGSSKRWTQDQLKQRVSMDPQSNTINWKLPQQNQGRISTASNHYYANMDLPVLVQPVQPINGQKA